MKKPTTTTVDKPTTGQSGPRIQMDLASFNPKERKVLDALQAYRTLSLPQLADICFPSKSKAKGNSWTRNSLRRVVCAGYVRKVAPGTYALTAHGQRQLGQVKPITGKAIRRLSKFTRNGTTATTSKSAVKRAA